MIRAGAAFLCVALAAQPVAAGESISLSLPPGLLQGAGAAATPQAQVSLPLDLSSLQKKSETRLALPPELTKHFDLFLFVNKSTQQMQVFRKTKTGFTLLHRWTISTGRERSERDHLGRLAFTTTPRGIYQLDANRFYAAAWSRKWNGPMPHAMFFDALHKGTKVGLAIHAAHDEEILRLGSRASAGCVRLAPEKAQFLFDLVRRDYAGDVPRFAVDAKTGTTRRDGALLRDGSGKIQFAKGYRVLVIVEEDQRRNS